MPVPKKTYNELLEINKQLFEENKHLNEKLNFVANRDINISAFLEIIPQMVSYTNKNLIYEYVNKAYKTIFGIEPKNIVGKRLIDFIGKKAFQRAKKHIDNVLEGKEVRYMEEFDYKNSGTKNIEGHLIPDIGFNGEVNGYWAILNDITERKRQFDIILENELKYKKLINEAPVGILLFLNGIIELVNEELLKITGLDELKDYSVFYNMIHPDDRKIKKKMMDGTLNEFESYPINSNYRLIKKDGSKKYIAEFTSKFSINRKEYVQCIIEDITEVIEAENSKKRLLDEATYLDRKSRVFKRTEEELMTILMNNKYPKRKFRSLLQMLKNELKYDKHWDIFKDNFESLHSGFFKKLSGKFPKLTQREIKHCAYIKMNFETKQIANIFNIQPSSVQISRVRLKKKLGLNPDEDLIQFIQSV